MPRALICGYVGQGPRTLRTSGAGGVVAKPLLAHVTASAYGSHVAIGQRWTLLIAMVVVTLALALALVPLRAHGNACGSALIPRSLSGSVDLSASPSETRFPPRTQPTIRWLSPSELEELGMPRLSPSERARRAELQAEERERAERRERAAAGLWEMEQSFRRANDQRQCSIAVEGRQSVAVLVGVVGLAIAAGGWLLLRSASPLTRHRTEE